MVEKFIYLALIKGFRDTLLARWVCDDLEIAKDCIYTELREFTKEYEVGNVFEVEQHKLGLDGQYHLTTTTLLDCVNFFVDRRNRRI